MVDHDDVHRTFSKYDTFLFPTYSENYGYVIVEFLVAGVPLLLAIKHLGTMCIIMVQKLDLFKIR